MPKYTFIIYIVLTNNARTSPNVPNTIPDCRNLIPTALYSFPILIGTEPQRGLQKNVLKMSARKYFSYSDGSNPQRGFDNVAMFAHDTNGPRLVLG